MLRVALRRLAVCGRRAVFSEHARGALRAAAVNVGLILVSDAVVTARSRAGIVVSTSLGDAVARCRASLTVVAGSAVRAAAVDVRFGLVLRAVGAVFRNALSDIGVTQHRRAVGWDQAAAADGAGGTVGTPAVDVGLLPVWSAVVTRGVRASPHCGVADIGLAVEEPLALVPGRTGRAAVASAVDVGFPSIARVVAARRGGAAAEAVVPAGRRDAVVVDAAALPRVTLGLAGPSTVDVRLITVLDSVATVRVLSVGCSVGLGLPRGRAG